MKSDYIFIEESDEELAEIEQANRTLIERTTQLGSVLTNLPVGFLIHRDQSIVYSNPAACRLFEVEHAALFGRHILDFADLSAHFSSQLTATTKLFNIDSDEGMHFDDVTIKGDHGRVSIVSLTFNRLNWDGAPLTQITMQDLTALKASQQFLSIAKDQADKANHTKSEFLTHMSHELRTPLNAIIGFSQIWMDECFGPIRNSKYMEYAKDINYASTHLLEIISDILDLSKIGAQEVELDLQEVELAEVVESCVSMLKDNSKSGGVELNYSISPNTPVLRADRRYLKQIIINIAGNAIKYTKPGGQVNIDFNLTEGKSTLLTISDTGVGIPQKYLGVVMEPFGQARVRSDIAHEGTGLGLPLAKQMVEQHGGWFEIDSEVDKGTIITMCFPPPLG